MKSHTERVRDGLVYARLLDTWISNTALNGQAAIDQLYAHLVADGRHTNPPAPDAEQ